MTDWRDRAACRGTPELMVPDDDQLGVQLAKKICADCPVVSSCFAYAEQLTKAYGHQAPEGVWGGFTLQERNTMAGLRRDPEPCPQCGLLCVPVSFATDRCQVCDPATPLTYLDYRPQVLELIAAGWTYRQVAERLRLSKEGVASACRRWKVKNAATKRSQRPLKECGTLAAKTRHARRGESWEDCPCKHVAWKRGRYRGEHSNR